LRALFARLLQVGSNGGNPRRGDPSCHGTEGGAARK
jgi:hypothetical protein